MSLGRGAYDSFKKIAQALERIAYALERQGQDDAERIAKWLDEIDPHIAADVRAGRWRE